MKPIIFLSSLLFLISCGKEQFGTAAQSQNESIDPLRGFKQTSCSSFSLIKPKVDILYVVDNSESTRHLKDDIKKSIRNTLQTISSDFDYRVISTPLMSTSSIDYSVYTNSNDSLPNSSLKVPTTDALIDHIFTNIGGGTERGLQRSIDFMNAHSSSGLLRRGAYHLVILVSNGRDEEVEKDLYGNGETGYVTPTVFNTRRQSFNQLKTNLASQQLRFFSVTATTSCKSGWRSSQKSYQEMSKQLYTASGASDSPSKDVYDLCGTGLSTLFAGVNSSIQKVLLNHEYRYWPITFADNNESTVDLENVKVFKVSNSIASELPSSDWTYHHNASGGPLNTRELPTAGEPISGKHFIRFNNRIVYPDCVQVTSTTKQEYFGYISIPRKPKAGTLIVRINGRTIPESSSNGWTFDNIFKTNTINIKMPYPTPSHATPAVMKSGYLIKLNGTANYYKSGDSIQLDYIPDAI